MIHVGANVSMGFKILVGAYVPMILKDMKIRCTSVISSFTGKRLGTTKPGILPIKNGQVEAQKEN